MTRRGLTLIEVLLAVVLLAAVVVACLPLLRPAPVAGDPASSPTLRAVAAENDLVPPGATLESFPGHAGDKTEGNWRIITSGTHFGIAWVEETDTP